MLLSDRFSALAQDGGKTQRSPEAEALSAQIRQDIMNKVVKTEEKEKTEKK
jgi:hypothetical protein